ncbi:hydroxymethylbilane synthase [Parapedobacter luteus]|uniref:Hydroxymethylbilane synthase n=1 Tax=Parapedobacter luteus TaxID=623280 RepID=A0A1T5ENK6_9SPHI|nr:MULTISPECIES: hydroxymethylbilane synthase [Parapedobacter]SKB85527.1 hydroxymethylbilane synthase [Parapedobacter luteus]
MLIEEPLVNTAATSTQKIDRTLIIGTRGSELALWQANYIKDRLADIGVRAELKIIKTQGDIVQHLRLDKLEGKGFFTKELEEELLSGGIDLAVHSHKDLPTLHPVGLTIAAVSSREDPAELLIIHKDCVDLKKRLALKHNAIVGTSSNRRKAQLLAMRPDLEFDDLRGNVLTRIEKLRDENYDAIMLAKAGLTRIAADLSDFHVEELPPVEIIPAPAQGVLAVQIRESDKALYQVLQAIHDTEVADTIAVERKVLNLFDAGCHAPLGCYCRKQQGKYEVWTSKADSEDEFPDRLYLSSDSPEGLAERIAAKFDKNRKFPSQVFITRDISAASYFYRAMAKHGIAVDGRSLIRIFPIINKLDPYILKYVDWIFFGSKNGIENFFRLEPRLSKRTKFAVIGRGSEEMLRQFGHAPDFSGERLGINMEEIATEFAKIASGTTVLIPRAKDSLETIQKSLTADTKIINLPVYQTRMDTNVDKSNADVLIFTSPTNVEAYFADNLVEPGQKIICIGRSTGKRIEELGLPYTLPYSPDEIGLAEAVFGLDY